MYGLVFIIQEEAILFPDYNGSENRKGKANEKDKSIFAFYIMEHRYNYSHNSRIHNVTCTDSVEETRGGYT